MRRGNHVKKKAFQSNANRPLSDKCKHRQTDMSRNIALPKLFWHAVRYNYYINLIKIERNFIISVADPMVGTLGTCTPSRANFFNFHTVILPKIGWRVEQLLRALGFIHTCDLSQK